MQANPRLFSLLGLLIGGVFWLAVASPRTLVWADEVYDWNIAGFDITVAGGQNPILISRTLAMMHLAIHDALNAIDRRYEPYLSERRAEPNAAPGAAVAVPPARAPAAEERAVRARLQRGEATRRQEQHGTHGHAGGDRQILV
jgi:hypothetical protein